MPKMNTVTLYLTDWQKRMVQDNLKAAYRPKIYSKIIISHLTKIDLVTYRVPVFESIKAGAWNLYLTNEQIVQVSEVLGIKTKISALNISPAMFESKAICLE